MTVVLELWIRLSATAFRNYSRSKEKHRCSASRSYLILSNNTSPGWLTSPPTCHQHSGGNNSAHDQGIRTAVPQRPLVLIVSLNMSRILLEQIPALTFYKDAITSAKRTSPIPQLVCVGRACDLYTPDAVRCTNIGGHGTDVDWKASTPSSARKGLAV
jgi:SOCE-associated regulatory factor of calcium homoeostasis